MAEISYPYTRVTATYGDLQSVGITISSEGDGGPEGTDLNSVVAVVRAYLEGLDGIDNTVAYRTELVQTQQT